MVSTKHRDLVIRSLRVAKDEYLTAMETPTDPVSRMDAVDHLACARAMCWHMGLTGKEIQAIETDEESCHVPTR